MRPLTDIMLMNAHAMPMAGAEPHGQVGAHLRVSHHPGLGLPVGPFVVWRAVARSRKALRKRNAVTFLDANGAVLTPPFNVTAGNPVTARIVLAAGEVCIWAQLQAAAREDLEGRDPSEGGGAVFNPTLSSAAATVTSSNLRDRIIREAALQPARRGALPGSIRTDTPGRRTGTLRPDLVVRPDALRPDLLRPAPSGKLVAEAFIDGAVAPASTGTRSAAPWAFTAPGLVELRITGEGRVGGLDWIEMHDRQDLKWEPYAVLNLPAKSGLRYISITDPEGESIRRVDLQAPKRRPLQETQNTPTPAAAPPFSQGEERDRVRSLVPSIPNDLDSLINDPTPPLEQIETDTAVIDENGTHIGLSSVAKLHRVHQGQADPGTASWLGYKLRDEDWRETEDRIVFYHVDGYFRDTTPPLNFVDPDIPLSTILLKFKLAQIPPAGRDLSRGQVVELLGNGIGPINGVKLDPEGADRLADETDYVSTGFIAAADLAAPLDMVPPPVLVRAVHRSWIPETPPAARREVQIDIEGARIAGLLAAAKRTPASGAGSFATINPRNADGWHLPLVLSLNGQHSTGETVAASGAGFIADRKAEAPDIRYFVTQQDRFGRFSDWASRIAPPGPRPKPPRPHLQAFYTQPPVALAATQGGTILVKVPVPNASALAPGSHLLASLDLEIDDLSTPSTTTVTVAEATKQPAPNDPTSFFLNIPRTGPVLAPTATRKIRFTARWRDTSGQLSETSEPVTLTLTDPRPPAQIPVPDQLQYAARPDVTGLSWVEHRWMPAAGQARFGIYYSDENRFRGWLAQTGQTAVVASLDAAAHAAARATIYRANRALFPDHLFERLDGATVDFASGEKGFRHGVSGSLRILNFYLIAAEAESGAKPVISGLEFIVYGIPNSDPPARPALAVTPVEPQPGEHDFVAEVAISLRAGTTLGETWRLRRSSFESTNIAKMPVVTSGPMDALDTATGLQSAIFRDDGPVEIAAHARLAPWKRYTWVAEVQGAPESGSAAAGRTVAGRWSRASDPASVVLVPAAPPDAVDPVTLSLTGTSTAAGLDMPRLRFTYGSDLASGALGAFTLKIARRPGPGAPLVNLDEVTVSEHRATGLPTDPTGSTAFEVSGLAPGEMPTTVPTGAEYVLELIDPMGRTSAPTTIAVP